MISRKKNGVIGPDDSPLERLPSHSILGGRFLLTPILGIKDSLWDKITALQDVNFLM